MLSPDDSAFPAFLSQAVALLSEHRSLFREIRDTGGRVEFYIGLTAGGGMLGETIAYDLLHSLGDLGVDLSLDTMYAPETSNPA